MANIEVWTIQKLLKWLTKRFTDKRIVSPRLSAETSFPDARAFVRPGFDEPERAAE